MDRAKPYDIPKREVWEAYKRVRANQGAAGVDGQMISDFEADLENNLYKLWNRLSRPHRRRPGPALRRQCARLGLPRRLYLDPARPCVAGSGTGLGCGCAC